MKYKALYEIKNWDKTKFKINCLRLKNCDDKQQDDTIILLLLFVTFVNLMQLRNVDRLKMKTDRFLTDNLDEMKGI